LQFAAGSGGPELPPPLANRRQRFLLTWIRDDSSTWVPGQAAPLPEELAADVTGGSMNGDLLVLDLCIPGLFLIY